MARAQSQSQIMFNKKSVSLTIQLSSSCNTYKYSFTSGTIKDWNALPTELL